ncbi:MAG: glycosyltransferase family 2 protein [Chitinispirillales bacterium]|jgi:GT2 family glycosyltransferase|nr:glycosyltransferase family 2 protein [Chitinispirillales bacterium]
MSLVSIIIVNWNGAEVLPECLRSLLGLNHKDIEIVVVDNASTDGSVAVVRKICSGAKVVRLEKNVGFAAGVNIGFENAAGEFIATLNNDMVAEPSWLDMPLMLLEDGTVGIVSCRQMNYYDRTKVDGLYHYITKDLVFMPFAEGSAYQDGGLLSKSGYVISANGGSAVIRAGVFRALGGYDANFFGYMEETDFCMRAFLRGWRCVYAPDAVVYHMNGFSFKKIGGHQFYLLARNRVWFLYKNIPIKDILKRLPYILSNEWHTFKESFSKPKSPSLYFKAKWDALCGLWSYRGIRRENAALFKAKRNDYYGFERNKIFN